MLSEDKESQIVYEHHFEDEARSLTHSRSDRRSLWSTHPSS